jgi:dipeptidyl aminopeptidase/acylaminoacyl peptidase
MTVVRAAAVCVLVLSSAACISFAETSECGAPPLVVMTGSVADPLGTEPTVQLWDSKGEAQLLTDDPAAAWPAMSPDGETVAVALGEGEWSGAQGWDASRVALLSVDAGEVSLLSREVPGTEVAYLQWSTSGAQVAFVRSGPNGREIVAVDVETGVERRLLLLIAGQQAFTWSPDGAEMLVPTYIESPDGITVELRRYFLGSGHHVVVTTFEDGIGQISWSPGGRWVALQYFLPGTTRLRQFVLDIETGDTVPVDVRRGGPQSTTWSGPYLFYVYNVGPTPEPTLMSWDSRTQRRATVDRAGLERFALGPISAPRCDSASV